MKKILYIFLGMMMMTAGTVYALPYFRSDQTIIPFVDNSYDLGTTSKAWRDFYVYQICLSGDCKTAWPTGGGGSGGGSWSTTTSSVTGRLINYSNNTTDIVVIGGTATSTGATEYWFDPNTQNAHIGSSNTASTSVMGLFLLPTVGQGFLYGGTGGNVNAIASSSVRLSWFNNDAGFITSPASTTLLSDFNTFSGRNVFTYASTTNLDVTGTGTTTIAGAVQIGSTAGDHALKITSRSGGYPASSSVGGMVNLTNTNNFGQALNIYSNAGVGRTNDLLNIVNDNVLNDQRALFITQDGTRSGALINCTNATRVSGGECVNITDVAGANRTTLGVSGAPVGLGLLKFVVNSGSDANASALSVQIDDTDPQGIFVDTIAGYTGKFLNLRNNGTDMLTLSANGLLTTPYSSSTAYSSFVTASTTFLRVGLADGCANITSGLLGSTGSPCSSGGGGSGSGTISTTTPLVNTQVAFSTGVSTIGNDSNFTFDSVSDRLTVSYASTTGLSTSYASSTVGYIGSLFLPSVSQGYSYIGSNGLLNTISTSTLFSQMNLFDLDTNTPFGTPLNSVYRIRSSFNNFLSNSSFEGWLSGTSVAPSGWTLSGDATVSRSSTATINSYSAQVVFGTANTGELYQVIDTSTLVDYTFSAYVQRTSGTGNARLVAQRADAPFTEFVSVPLSTGGGWQLITLTVKPSAGTQTRFAIKSSDAVASTWLIDEAMFQEGKNLASTWLPAYIDDTNNQQVYGSKTFNALQTFNYSSSTVYSSFLTASSTFLNAGSITLATTTAGTLKINSSGLVYSDPSGGGGGVTSVTATYPMISSGGTTPNISIAFSTTTTNIWSALNTFNGGLTIGTTTAGILRTNASGVVYASTATSTMSLFNDFTIPDSSGDVWLAPNSINSANSVSDQMVFVASSSVAKVGIHGSILIPSNFSSSSAKVRFAWTATSTSNAVVNDFDYRCVSGNNTTSLYQTSWQENKTVTTNNPSTAGYRITSTMDINAGYYCSAGDTMQFFLTRDGTDGSDTSTVDQEIFSASIDLLTQ